MQMTTKAVCQSQGSFVWFAFQLRDKKNDKSEIRRSTVDLKLEARLAFYDENPLQQFTINHTHCGAWMIDQIKTRVDYQH
jgi:hypothetical protein